MENCVQEITKEVKNLEVDLKTTDINNIDAVDKINDKAKMLIRDIYYCEKKTKSNDALILLEKRVIAIISELETEE